MGFRRTGNGEILAINALISFPSKIHSERSRRLENLEISVSCCPWNWIRLDSRGLISHLQDGP